MVMKSDGGGGHDDGDDVHGDDGGDVHGDDDAHGDDDVLGDATRFRCQHERLLGP